MHEALELHAMHGGVSHLQLAQPGKIKLILLRFRKTQKYNKNILRVWMF